MRASQPEPLKIDAIAAEDDMFDIRIEHRPQGDVLYVDCNGITMLRVGRIIQPVMIREDAHTTP